MEAFPFLQVNYMAESTLILLNMLLILKSTKRKILNQQLRNMT